MLRSCASVVLSAMLTSSSALVPSAMLTSSALVLSTVLTSSALVPAAWAQQSVRVQRPGYEEVVHGDAAALSPSLPALSPSQWFSRRLKVYAMPPICPMLFCHGSCAGFDDSCGPFSGLQVLDSDRLGHLITQRYCSNNLSRAAPPDTVPNHCAGE